MKLIKQQSQTPGRGPLTMPQKGRSHTKLCPPDHCGSSGEPLEGVDVDFFAERLYQSEY